jgi:methylase of polypeptide subunit release factors
MVGAPVDRADAAEALAPATVEELEAGGLIDVFDASRVRTAIVIKPYRDLLIASDRLFVEPAEPHDYVPGVNPVARLLAEQTIRARVRSALDLGTGNGTQMLAAARHADHVLGTDVNPRALAYARFNARLNSVENVTLAEGSWFDPVGDEQFDLILANIPFVVSPDAKSLYRDSGGAPGEISASVVQGAASRLAEGGFAHVMCEWGVAEGEEWSRAPSEWVRETGCDAVILRHDYSDPLAHSVAWNHRLVGVDPDAFEEAVERWTTHHRDHGFAALAAATIVLRRRAQAPTAWISALEFGRGAPHDGSHHVLRLFRGGDFLQAIHGEPERILRERLALADGVRLDQVLTRREERWRQRPAKLSLRPGLALTASVEPRALDLVFALDGRPVEEVIRAVGERRGTGEAELRALALDALPELVRRGFVTVGG